MTWRFHPPSDQPAGFRTLTGLTADVTDGVPYTIAYVPGDEFVEMAWVDHVAARDAGYSKGEWDAPEPPGGFRRFIRAAKTSLGRDHVLCLLVAAAAAYRCALVGPRLLLVRRLHRGWVNRPAWLQELGLGPLHSRGASPL